MKLSIERVKIDQSDILLNLIEKYEYEFSQWNKRDIDESGLFGYPNLDDYFNKEHYGAFFIMADGKLAGFAMIDNQAEVDDRDTDFRMAEYFILHKYRRYGLGKLAFLELLAMHPGKWQLRLHPHNEASVYFWERVVSEYTNGDYEFIRFYPNTAYFDGTLGHIFFFNSKGRIS